MSASVLPMFSSKSFIVSGLVFRSLIHFGLLFVYRIKEWSNFIFFLHVVVQFSQHHLLKRLFPTSCSLASFVIDWPRTMILMTLVSGHYSVAWTSPGIDFLIPQWGAHLFLHLVINVKGEATGGMQKLSTILAWWLSYEYTNRHLVSSDFFFSHKCDPLKVSLSWVMKVGHLKVGSFKY